MPAPVSCRQATPLPLLTARVYSWAGLNDRGQCGTGDTDTRLAPGRVEALDASCVAVACGFEHTVAVTQAGDVFGWGGNEYGQTGCGADATHVVTPRLARPPRGDPALRCVVAVACGAHHTLALTSVGAVLAWGANAAGQCGTGDTVDRRTPAPVALSGVVAVSIAAGKAHTIAASASGEAYAWGRAAGGALGLTTHADSNEPAAIDSAPLRPAPAAVVAVLCDMGIPRAAAERAAAATPSVEAAVEFALQHADAPHSAAQRNVGISTGAQLLPRRITAAAGADACLPAVAAVSCGARHTVLVTHCGAAFTCGAGATGALGHGGTANELLPRRVTRLAGTRVVAVAAGSAHTLFLGDDGVVHACGAGQDGALGIEDGRDKALPVPLLPWAPPVRAVTAGGSSSVFLCPEDAGAIAVALKASSSAAELDAALDAAEAAVGASANALALRAVAAAVDAAFGSVRGAAATFMCRPVAPGGALMDAQRVEVASVRALNLGLRAPEVVAALREATTRLVDELEASWTQQAGACEATAAAAVAAQSVLLSQPALAAPLLRKLCPLLAAPPPRFRALLLAGWAETPGALLASRSVRPLQVRARSHQRASRPAQLTRSLADVCDGRAEGCQRNDARRGGRHPHAVAARGGQPRT